MPDGARPLQAAPARGHLAVHLLPRGHAERPAVLGPTVRPAVDREARARPSGGRGPGPGRGGASGPKARGRLWRSGLPGAATGARTGAALGRAAGRPSSASGAPRAEADAPPSPAAGSRGE